MQPDRLRLPLLLCLVLFAPAPLLADAYNDARRSLVEAYQAGDHAAMRVAARAALEARPDYPGGLYNLAFSETLDGDLDAAFDTLHRLAEMQVDFGIADTDEFAPLKEHSRWPDYARAIELASKPVGSPVVAITYDAARFVPEGIELDGAGGVYLGSIRDGRIVHVGDTATTLVEAGGMTHWSVFGMRRDGERGLWFASAHTPQFDGPRDRSAFRTGLFFFDFDASEITRQARLPVAGERQALGDLVIADANTIYTADQLDGVIYRYSIADDAYTILVDRGVLRSPQGLVLDASGDHLYVADYIGGLYRIALADGRVERLAVPSNVSPYGIDGLYRHGDTLVAVQNGVQPNRVLAMQLAADGRSIASGRILAMNHPEFDEPNLGVLDGNQFYFIANSHWNRFDRDNNLPDGLSGPIVMRIAVWP